MATSAEIQMLRNADPGAILPGIDTPTGNPDPASSLMSYTQITQNAKGSPYYYNPTNNIVYVTQAGAVLSGINFGSATLAIEANNVTVQDCTFTATTSFWTVDQTPGYSGATIEDCTFQGSGSPTENNVWINATQSITIKDNSFLNSPGDAIDIEGGVVTGNYFSGAGFLPGAHADAIQILAATGPTTITDNFIDGAWNPSAPANANSDIRIVTEGSNISNVNISGNYLSGEPTPLKSAPSPAPATRSVTLRSTTITLGFPSLAPIMGPFRTTRPFKEIRSSPIQIRPPRPRRLPHTRRPQFCRRMSSRQPPPAKSSPAPHRRRPRYWATAEQLLSDRPTKRISSAGMTRMSRWAGKERTSSPSSPSPIQPRAPTTRSRILTRPRTSSTSAASTPTSQLPGFSISRLSALPHSVEPAPRCAISWTRRPTKPNLAGNSGNYWPDFEIVLAGLLPLTAANFALTAAQSATDMANGAALRACPRK